MANYRLGKTKILGGKKMNEFELLANELRKNTEAVIALLDAVNANNCITKESNELIHENNKIMKESFRK